MSSLNHPILEQSFAIIDQEIGEHNFNPAEYAIIRRVIHSTADFEFKHLMRFSPGAIAAAIAALAASDVYKRQEWWAGRVAGLG